MSITAYLCVHDGAAAIDFYRRAFGAEETGPRFTDPEGRIGHAEISIDGTRLFLSDEYPDFNALSPKTLGGAAVALHLEVPDADAAAARLVEAGATTERVVAEQADGERRGVFVDPFGYRWMIGQKVEDVTKEELRSRVSGFEVT
ncbi:MAG: VOC family protein [Gammaproteobacteria bacterium]|nr:VOC family protein [Gammaproteobacteria bacterium]